MLVVEKIRVSKSILKGTLYIRKSDKKIILVDVKNREYFAKGFFDPLIEYQLWVIDNPRYDKLIYLVIV